MNAFAGALAARGVGTETVLGLLCPNVPAFATVFHGILRAGAIVTTINSLYTAGEIEKQLRDAGATWLITVSPLLPQAKAAAAEAVGISARPRHRARRRRRAPEPARAAHGAGGPAPR